MDQFLSTPFSKLLKLINIQIYPGKGRLYHPIIIHSANLPCLPFIGYKANAGLIVWVKLFMRYASIIIYVSIQKLYVFAEALRLWVVQCNGLSRHFAPNCQSPLLSATQCPPPTDVGH